MIWTIIIVLALGASIVAYRSSEYGSDGFIASIFGMVATGFTLLCIGIVIIGANTFHERNLAALQAERDALVYQVENNMFLGDAVGKFNSELIRHQIGHENPWTSWFYGSYWTEVDIVKFDNNK